MRVKRFRWQRLLKTFLQHWGRAVGLLNLVNTTLGKPDSSLQTGRHAHSLLAFGHTTVTWCLQMIQHYFINSMYLTYLNFF